MSIMKTLSLATLMLVTLCESVVKINVDVTVEDFQAAINNVIVIDALKRFIDRAELAFKEIDGTDQMKFKAINHEDVKVAPHIFKIEALIKYVSQTLQNNPHADGVSELVKSSPDYESWKKSYKLLADVIEVVNKKIKEHKGNTKEIEDSPDADEHYTKFKNDILKIVSSTMSELENLNAIAPKNGRPWNSVVVQEANMNCEFILLYDDVNVEHIHELCNKNDLRIAKYAHCDVETVDFADIFVGKGESQLYTQHFPFIVSLYNDANNPLTAFKFTEPQVKYINVLRTLKKVSVTGKLGYCKIQCSDVNTCQLKMSFEEAAAVTTSVVRRMLV